MRSLQNNILFLLALSVVACDTASSVYPLYKDYFVRYYGEDGDHISVDMVVNADFSYTMLGALITPSGERKIFVSKVDPAGNQLWQNVLGVDEEYPQDIELLPTGGYVILSNVLVDPINDYHVFKLIRTDPFGNKVDSLQYDSLFDQYGRSVTPLANGGFFVSGRTKQSDPANDDVNKLPVPEQEELLIVRFESTFTKVDSELFRIGNSSIGYVLKVFENADATFTYVAAADELTTNDVSGYEMNFVFRKFVNTPNENEGEYVGDDIKNEFMEYATIGADGNIYAIGRAEASPTSTSILVTRVGNSATVPSKLFSKDFGPGIRIEGVALYPIGGFCYVLANLYDEADGTRDMWLSRVSAFDGSQSGSWIIGQTYGSSSNDDTGARVYQAPDGSIVILGTVNITNQKKMALIKVNRSGGFE